MLRFVSARCFISNSAVRFIRRKKQTAAMPREEGARCLSVKLASPPRRKMDRNEEAVQASGSKTLLVRHLPAELSQDEKEDLLKYFGAQSVRVFPNRGRMVSSDASFFFFFFFPIQRLVYMSHGLFPARRNTLPLQRLGARNRQQK